MNYNFEWLPIFQKYLNKNKIFFEDKDIKDIFSSKEVKNISINGKEIDLTIDGKKETVVFFIDKSNQWGGDLYILSKNKTIMNKLGDTWNKMTNELNK